MKNKKRLLTALAMLLSLLVQAQVSGRVYRDFNSNGTRQNSAATLVEPGVQGIIINAFNNSEVLIATQTTNSTGVYTFPATGPNSIASGTTVRLEFVIPSSLLCDLGNKYNSSFSGTGNGTAVQFITSGAAAININYAINDPTEFVFDAAPFNNTFFYQALNVFGNPTASPAGTAANQMAFVKYPYSRSGTTAIQANEILARFSQIGSVYGVAYSKHAKRIFTSAYLKRHSGLGPANGVFNNAPGAIYIINPALTSSTGAASYFTSLDALGFPTHNSTGSPAYGSGTSYNITVPVAGVGPDWFGREEAINYIGAGGSVIGTNTQRGLNKDSSVATNDPAAYDQIGKLSLGDLEISDDGRYLFVTNLYDRKIYQLQLNNVYNPTSAVVINSWNLPNPPLRSTANIPNAALTYTGANNNTDFYTGARGVQRPFGLKYYNGKLYVGSVTTAEGPSGQTTTDNNAGNPEYTDLWSYVWELSPSTGFNPTPAVQFPLNFNRLLDDDGIVETFNKWTNKMPAVNTVFFGHPQPMLAGIEFDIDGSMIIAFRDRIGDQAGTANHMLLDNRASRTVEAYGDILRAYKNTNCIGWTIESNGDKDGPGPYVATAAQKNGQGPSNYTDGNGEFYYEDGIEVWNGVITNQRYHLNTNQGSLAIIPGTQEVASTVMDPVDYVTGGIAWYNNNTGANPRDYVVYSGTTYNVNPGEPAKGNGMGDMELLTEMAPIEIGNRVWLDTNGDGIQNANESGIGNVTLQLFVDSNNDGLPDGAAIGTTTTASSGAVGSWYFKSTNITGDADPNTSGVQTTLTSGITYLIRPSSTSWASGVGVGTLANLFLTAANKVGSGQVDFSNSDAIMNTTQAVPQINYTVLGAGINNHNLDFGFRPGNAIGDRVWLDANTNGVQENNEVGVPNITVNLYNSSLTLVASTITDAHGYWTIPFVPIGTGYFVHFDNKPSNLNWTLFHVGDVGTSKTTGVDDAHDDSDANPGGYTMPFEIIGSMNDYKIDGGLSPDIGLLNIDFLNFSAQKVNRTTLLSFEINESVNGDLIFIERSITGGENFEKIGNITGTVQRKYNFTDENPVFNKSNDYRIKIIERSGAIKYSEIRRVDFNAGFTLKVYPNPTSNFINISIGKELVNKNCIIKLYNTEGKLILNKKLYNARVFETIDVSQFSNGQYIIQLIQKNHVIGHSKFVILN